MSKFFLKENETGELLSVIGGKIFTSPEEAVAKNVTASFLDCIDLNNQQHLVYIAYTLTGSISERNKHTVLAGEEAENAAHLFENVLPDAGPASQQVIDVANLRIEEEKIAAALALAAEQTTQTTEEVISESYRSN